MLFSSLILILFSLSMAMNTRHMQQKHTHNNHRKSSACMQIASNKQKYIREKLATSKQRLSIEDIKYYVPEQKKCR